MLPFRSSRGRNAALGAFVSLAISSAIVLAAEQSPSPGKKERHGGSLTKLPLPIGQEAKGLVLPDIDMEGHLRARFEAGGAKRIDTEHVEFRDLKMVTFTPENARDLLIEMPHSTLNLETQVIESHARTSVSRTDFTIMGDKMNFDTLARKGTLVGNVKMVITGQASAGKKTEQ